MPLPIDVPKPPRRDLDSPEQRMVDAYLANCDALPRALYAVIASYAAFHPLLFCDHTRRDTDGLAANVQWLGARAEVGSRAAFYYAVSLPALGGVPTPTVVWHDATRSLHALTVDSHHVLSFGEDGRPNGLPDAPTALPDDRAAAVPSDRASTVDHVVWTPRAAPGRPSRCGGTCDICLLGDRLFRISPLFASDSLLLVRVYNPDSDTWIEDADTRALEHTPSVNYHPHFLAAGSVLYMFGEGLSQSEADVCCVFRLAERTWHEVRTRPDGGTAWAASDGGNILALSIIGASNAADTDDAKDANGRDVSVSVTRLGILGSLDTVRHTSSVPGDAVVNGLHVRWTLPGIPGQRHVVLKSHWFEPFSKRVYVALYWECVRPYRQYYMAASHAVDVGDATFVDAAGRPLGLTSSPPWTVEAHNSKALGVDTYSLRKRTHVVAVLAAPAVAH